MENWDKLLRPETLVLLLAFGIPVVAIICSTISSILKQRSADELKSLMIERGMSADEIERVIKASPDKDSKVKK